LHSAQRVLLAVSGGRDSVVLTDLMARAGYSFAIAHCNFHLRPGDCDRDELFVRSLATRYGVECFVAHFDTETYAHTNNLSVEEAARNLRYGFFERIRQQHSFSAVATAHHRDDAVETFFINLLRGTGVSGLHGIMARNGHVIRPLLPFGRDEIDAYVAQHALSYVDDYTNFEPLYLRNRIRLQLIPLLRDLSPHFDSTMQANMRHLAETEQILHDAVEQARQSAVVADGDTLRVDISVLRRLDPLSTYLFELLRPYGFSPALCEEVMAALDGQSGKQFFSPTHRLLKDRDSLIISPLLADDAADAFCIDAPDTICPERCPVRLSVAPVPQGTLRLSPDEAMFDADQLRFPLLVRHWRHADRISPFGMKGSRLVSDIFSDKKLSLDDKERAWLLCDADGVVLWVVGIRASSVAPVTGSTSRVLMCHKV